MPYYTWMNPRTVFFLDFFWNIGSSHPYIRLKKDHRDTASFRNAFKQQFFLPHTMAPKLKSGFLNKKSKYVPPTYLLVAFCIWSTFSQQQKTAKSKCLLALNKNPEVFAFSIIFECVWKSMRKPTKWLGSRLENGRTKMGWNLVNCWWVEHPSCYVAKNPQKFFGSFWEKAFLLILFGCFFENLKIFCVSVRVGSWTFLLFLFFWLIGTYRTWHWSSGRWTFLPPRTQHCFRETRKSWMNFKTRVWRSCLGVVGFDVAWFPSTFHPGIW